MSEGKIIISFKEWISRYIDSPNPYGDLARDMKKDVNLPNSNKRNDIDRYLDLECRACEQALKTFHSAFSEYEKYILTTLHRTS